jgi:hypothetical protein
MVMVLAGISGCFPLLSSKGSLVHIERDREMIRKCAPLGTVSGTSSLGLSKNQKTEQALNEVRNRAALMGADTVFIVSMDSMFEGTVVRGNAYDCTDNLL